MNTFFEDEFINKKLLNRITKEIRKQQLDITIDELECLNEIQSRVISKYNFKLQPSKILKKINNGRKYL